MYSTPRKSAFLLAAAGVALLGLAFRSGAPADLPPDWTVFAAVLALLAPIGLALVAGGGLRDQRAALTVLMALVALSLASVGYLLTGFAFQFGGVGLWVRTPGLEHLIWEWSPLDLEWGMGWGVIGLNGFLLGPDASNPATYTLFLSQLGPLSVAVLLPLVALRGRVRPPVLFVGVALLAMALYPIAGNWVWGGGWLANLGLNVGLGHGFVDFMGAGTVHLLGAMVALAGMLVFLPARAAAVPARMPPVHLPIMAILGGFLLIPGWLGLAQANPLLASAQVAWPVVALNLILAAVGGSLLALLYAWFTTGGANIFMTIRGLVAGLVAISAAVPFVPPWAALFIGGVAGLLLPPFAYFITHVLRLDDDALVVPVHGISGFWGLAAVGLFADGRYGTGWNFVGADQYLDVTGQGVSGLLAGAGFQPDFPGQLYAQCIGSMAIAVFAFLVVWLVFKVLAHFVEAWEGAWPDGAAGFEGEEATPMLFVPNELREEPPPS